MPSNFPTTDWSRVARAVNRALAELCARLLVSDLCVHPSQGTSARRAARPRPGHFSPLLRPRRPAAVDAGARPFPPFLWPPVPTILADRRDRDRAAKRGGGAVHIPIDASMRKAATRPSRSTT